MDISLCIAPNVNMSMERYSMYAIMYCTVNGWMECIFHPFISRNMSMCESNHFTATFMPSPCVSYSISDFYVAYQYYIHTFTHPHPYLFLHSEYYGFLPFIFVISFAFLIDCEIIYLYILIA